MDHRYSILIEGIKTNNTSYIIVIYPKQPQRSTRKLAGFS